MKEKIALIDLGSNSIRMNIIGIQHSGSYSIFDSAKEMVRLSEGMHEKMHLQDKPIKRTLDALRYFKKLIDFHEIQTVYPLCTAAVRMAKNKDAFLKLVEEEIGLNFHVLSGQEEAYYDYLGVVNSMDTEEGLIIDIGGGSTEIIHMKDRLLMHAVSLPFGAVILSEMFSDLKKEKNMKQASHHLLEAYEKISWLKDIKNIPIIGLGGSIRTLGKIDCYEKDYPIRSLHNYHLSNSQVHIIMNLIHETPNKKLGQIEGLSKKRTDIISHGVLPLKVLMDFIGSKDLFISGKGLRNGYFYKQYFSKLNRPSIVSDVLKHSTENLMLKYDVNFTHSHHVKHLALALFDGLKPLHDFNNEDRKVLEVSCLLHDIGMHIEYYDHHIHGMYLLLNTSLDGLRIKENFKVAFLVGNHRSGGLKNKIDDYATIFSKDDFKKIEALSLFLQIAEQLDRSIAGLIEDLEVSLNDGLTIQLYAKECPELEIAAAEKINDLFKKTYGQSYKLAYAPIV